MSKVTVHGIGKTMMSYDGPMRLSGLAVAAWWNHTLDTMKGWGAAPGDGEYDSMKIGDKDTIVVNIIRHEGSKEQG